MKPFNSKRTFWHGLVVAIMAVVFATSTALPAQAGPDCIGGTNYLGCGRGVTFYGGYNMGIGIGVSDRSSSLYDRVLYPGQWSTNFWPDMDTVYAGSRWCVQVQSNNTPVNWTICNNRKGVIDDRFAPYTFRPYPMSGSW